MLSSFLLHNNNKSFLDRGVTCDEKWILYENWHWLAQWLDRKEALKHSPKPNVHPRMVTVWWSAAGLIHYSVLNPSKTITSEKYAQQINEMHWKITVPSAGICQQKGPNSSPQQHLTTRCTTNISKVEQIGLWSFASSAIFTWPLTNSLPLLQASQ